MAVNDFLTFAGDPAANVMPQTDYAATGFAARLLGFSTGTALSIQLNKVWRQSSLMSSMLGSFVVNQVGLDMLDDGSPAGMTSLEAHFAQAVKQAALAGASFNYLPLSGGTLTGDLIINAGGNQITVNASAGSYASIFLNKLAGQGSQIAANTGASARWLLQLSTGEPETGANAGSNFALHRYTDGGSYIDAPLSANRASGVVNFTRAPTLNGGPLPYMPLTGGSFQGPIYVPAPGITYGGTTGHYISFGWNGNLNSYVDGSYQGDIAYQGWVNSRVGNYLPLGGGTVTGYTQFNAGVNIQGSLYLAGYVSFANLSDFANFTGSGWRYRQWAGNWYDAWNGANGTRMWVGWNGTSMQMDGSSNLSLSGNITTYARFVGIGGQPGWGLWKTDWGAMGCWLDAGNMWFGQVDASANPVNGHQRFGGDGVLTNFNGLVANNWLQVGQWLSVGTDLTVYRNQQINGWLNVVDYVNMNRLQVWGNAQVNSSVFVGASVFAQWSIISRNNFVAESGNPSFSSWRTDMGLGFGFRTDQVSPGVGLRWGQVDGEGGNLVNTLMILRSDGWLFVAGNVGTPSDERLKRDIEPNRCDSLAAIRALTPVSFTWKESGRHQALGLLASEVKQHLPGVVERANDLDHIDLVTLLVHAIRAIQQLAAERKEA